MNSLRFSGVEVWETCSAETTVPWMTRMSRPGLERQVVEARHALRRERRRGDDARLALDLLDALPDELGLDRLLVDGLHLAGRRVLGQLRDALELGVGVLEARPDALEVQDGQAAELADDPRRLGRDDAVHRRGEQRELEAVVAELPGDVDVVGVARAPRGHDRDVVEAIGAAGLLPAADLDLHQCILGSGADGRRTSSVAPERARDRPVANGPAPAAAYGTSAGSSRRCTTVSDRSRSTSRGSMRPAPRRWVDSAPQATPKRRHSAGGSPL